MSRTVRTFLTLGALAAAGAAGFWAGQAGLSWPALPFPLPWHQSASAPPLAATGPVIYYRDPDGRPAYSAGPARTADGRAYVAVRASEDVSLEPRASGQAAAPAAAGEPRRILYYRNPMGLPDTSPVPKKDSMGMDYIPVYAGEDADSGTVTVSPGRLQRTGVRSEPAEARQIQRQVRVPGSVQLDERRVSVVATRTDAFVQEVANVTTGDRVTRGQPLLKLYSPDIAAAGALYVTELASGAGSAGGARQRLENLGVPADTIAELERTRRVPLLFDWRAPRSGVVLERNAVDGMKTTAGAVLFRLADTSQVWVIADVPEYDMAAVRIGAAAVVRPRGLAGRTFEGRVTLIYPQVARDTRTTRVRIELANLEGLLLPDMYVDVVIASGSGGTVVAVAESAVIDSGTRQVVIIDRGEGKFEPREVKTGARGGGYVEIREGLAADERVVVSANFLIDAESNLKAALRAMTSGTTP